MKNKRLNSSRNEKRPWKAVINQALKRKVFPSWKKRFENAAHRMQSLEREEMERRLTPESTNFFQEIENHK